MILLPLFKGLSDPVRLRISYLLTQRDALCVCHITDALLLPQSTVSRHLNILKQSNLVMAERRGTWVYYRLAESEQVHLLADMLKNSGASDLQLQQDLTHLNTSTC
ncbi:MAG: metalloregulator ArsR/SmtB family transcription factor [Mariprofundaceae bacterium]|nr:metalloregulator ArsR/SmtB family transcription factor [Mariprofundaceae bacterium]